MTNDKIKKLFDGNKTWVQNQLKTNPNYFKEKSKEQKPDFLFISCSDSRVPVHLITGFGVFDFFDHTNIANQIRTDDNNFMSIINFAIEALNIKDIILCGHYNCGGIKACVDGADIDRVEDWVCNARHTYLDNKEELSKIDYKSNMLDRLSELNVIEESRKISQLPVVLKANKSGNKIKIHSWIYNIYNGELIDLSDNTTAD